MKTSELFEILKTKAEGAVPDLPPDFAAVAFFDLTGPDPAQWQATAANGRLSLAEGPPSAEPDLTVTLSSDTAVGLYQKTVNPLAAFMTGKVKVRGDAGKIALVRQLLTRR
ncbi:MAG: SCP2 sterol-binding domain-containing protein [Candidatus Adiutrix sp.]|jgi:putative sterol carrier protein|nr:SCP2 sterol-binding domain-containing protein [Candidatus Adiutrix sp.]